MRARVKSDASSDGEYAVRASLVGAGGQVAQQAERPLSLKAREGAEIVQQLRIERPHLWQGVEDPYLYQLVVELVRRGGGPVDRVAQAFGIRQMRFDPEKGVFLNGKKVPLHGVAIHQDLLGKGWALTDAELEATLGLVKEIGANTVWPAEAMPHSMPPKMLPEPTGVFHRSLPVLGSRP